ncbi:hypothetical protein [uncultured Methanofollis sp.]|nr:hypothetical protein [uncultured Methanofollis sp.]
MIMIEARQASSKGKGRCPATWRRKKGRRNDPAVTHIILWC